MSKANMLDQVEFWDSWHRKINEMVPAWGSSHFPFAERILPLLPTTTKAPLLDLGCGQCNDAQYFAQHGFEVYALDFSSVALEKARERLLQTSTLAPIHILQGDMSTRLPFDNDLFCAVYSHLSLHYFDDLTTLAIFGEIRRVLTGGGLLAFNVKSIHDVRYGEGEKLGPDTYNYKGHIRHFFSLEYARDLLVGWQIHLLEEYEGFYGQTTETSSFIKVIACKPISG